MSAERTKRGLVRRRVASNATPAERIMFHTDRSDDCWIWTACIDKHNGYGRLTIGNKTGLYAHRVSYEAFVGPIPDGLEIDHLCRVRACCNPHHLEAVTPQINNRRGESVGARALRRDLCLYGHPYDDHGVVRSGRRICRLCAITYKRLWKLVPYDEVMRRKREGLPVVDLGAYWLEQRTEERAA